MKILGAILVMTASCGIGFFCAGEVDKRKKELEEQYNLIRLIFGDIRYMRATLPEAVNKAIVRHQGSYSLFLRIIADRLSEAPGISLSDIWNDAVSNGLKQSSLKESDKQTLKNFGESVSLADRENVMMCFEQYISELKEEINGIKRAAGAKVKLYRSLGVLAGVFIVVLFI